VTVATFAGRWRDAVAGAHERPFLVWEDRSGRVTTWTYGEFDSLVAAVAGGLSGRGVKSGACVHLALASSPAFVATWLAAVQLGAWVVPSDPSSSASELAGHMSRTGPVVGLCSPDRAAAYRDAASGGPEVVAVDEDDTELGDLRGHPVAWADVDRPQPRDRAAVMFTSGTTSAPKGVIVTQANYAFAGDVMAAAAALRGGDRQLVVLPMFHANAQYYSFASAISVGASVALTASFSASGFLAQATRHGATHASLFAAPMRMILAKQPPPEPDIGLVHCWYAQNITHDQYDTLAAWFGCRPRQLYGMTETIPAVLTNRAASPVVDSMGQETLGCAVDLRPYGEEQMEVVVGGAPGFTLFDGYLDDPETTARSFTDGWFHTGDLARRDDDGRYYFGGRTGDVLKVAGENVSVVEVEAVLAAHPGVLEAAVIGEPDPMRDEVPVGFVVQQPGQPGLEATDLMAWCAARLAKSKRPIRIEIVPELPRTSVGKIRKFLLKGGARS
jgi:crotonobetaine/carnitine-CoA ligase